MLSRAAWRSLTDEEYADIAQVVAERKQTPMEDRQFIEAPDSVKKTIAGALVWAIHCEWQDNYRFVLLAGAMIIWQLGEGVLYLVRLIR